jgi:hypothetical protein
MKLALKRPAAPDKDAAKKDAAKDAAKAAAKKG